MIFLLSVWNVSLELIMIMFCFDPAHFLPEIYRSTPKEHFSWTTLRLLLSEEGARRGAYKRSDWLFWNKSCQQWFFSTIAEEAGKQTEIPFLKSERFCFSQTQRMRCWVKWFAVQVRSCSSATRRRSRELSFLPPTGIRFDVKLIDSALNTYRWNIWITIYKVQITKKFIMKHFKVLRQEEIRNRIMFKPKQLERINIW